jgi:hypothetical protein
MHGRTATTWKTNYSTYIEKRRSIGVKEDRYVGRFKGM